MNVRRRVRWVWLVVLDSFNEIVEDMKDVYRDRQ